MTMRKIILLIGFLSLFDFMSAQVGINTTTPHASAALDVTSPSNNKGVLLPRMTTAQKNAIINPASGLIVYDTSKKCLSQNVGTEATPIWICLAQDETRFFYMPSVAIDTRTLATGKTLNLYNEYKAQFGTPAAVSTGSPSNIPYFPNTGDLDYYITYYDPTIIKITNFTNAGLVTYNVIKTTHYHSFINVVFVVK